MSSANPSLVGGRNFTATGRSGAPTGTVAFTADGTPLSGCGAVALPSGNANYAVATGGAATVRDMCRIAFERIGRDYDSHLFVDPKLYRSAEVDVLLGNRAKANAKLGWKPVTDWETLVATMLDAAMERVAKE